MQPREIARKIERLILRHIRVPAFFLVKNGTEDASLRQPPPPGVTHGVRFRGAARQQKINADRARRRRLLAGTMIGVIGAGTLVAVIARFASTDFTLIAAALLGLCGVIVYDIVSRCSWEHMLADRYETLARNHDRLVREVARNRNDMAAMREALALAGREAEAQARRLPPPATVEARMLDAIASKLGALSDLPRPAPDTAEDVNILALEVQPVRRLPHADDNQQDPAIMTPEKIRALLQQAIRADQIDLFTQPVVSLPQRKTRIVEIFARIRAGAEGHLSADHYMPVAVQENLVAAIDNLLLLRSLQMLRETQDDGEALPCALNIGAATLHDAGFMNDLVAFLAQDRKLAARLIFELAQDDIADIDNAHTPIAPVLAGLSQLGCRFSMDRVHRRDLGIRRLKALHIRFLKLDAQWLVREGRSAGGLTRLTQMKKQLDSAGIDLIVEKIENETDLRELLDIGVDYGQGFLFAKPEPVGAHPLSTRRRHA